MAWRHWAAGLTNLIADPPRMLVVWSWIPCNSTGAGILMRRLFAGYPPGELWALTSKSTKRIAAPFNPVPPPERQTTVPEVQIHRRWLDKLALVLNRLLIPWFVWRGVRLVHREKIEAIFTVPWDHLTIAAYFIHKITGRPLCMYIMDDPAGARKFGGLRPILYGLLMPRIVRSCRRVWGVSEGMCEYIERAYSAKCLTLLPLLDVEGFREAVARTEPDGKRPFSVIFTGAIYSAQVDALRHLVNVIEREASENHSEQCVHLTLYTSLPAAGLERFGLVGKNVRRDEVPASEVSRVMAEADVAFLPLSFEPEMLHVVETSLPSKIAEYLAAGLPILAYAPRSSTVARYCRENDCGLVVDVPDEAALRDALIRLRNEPKLRSELSARAVEIAKKNHDAERIGRAFLRELCDN